MKQGLKIAIGGDHGDEDIGKAGEYVRANAEEHKGPELIRSIHTSITTRIIPVELIRRQLPPPRP